MKNRFLKILFLYVFSLSCIEFTFAKEFNFEISELEILDSGNIYKGGYINDERHGNGQMSWTDGSYYDG